MKTSPFRSITSNPFLRILTAALAALPAYAHAQPGVPVWTNYFDGPRGYGDAAYAVAVDPKNGNVYVTGRTETRNADDYMNDYATIGYSSSGVPLWTNLYDNPGGFTNDRPSAVAVESNTGDVIVTGYSHNTANSSQAYVSTIKYSSSGIPLWTNNGIFGVATAIVVDTNGNIFVTGSGSAFGENFQTIKYSSTGSVLWVRQYDGTGNNKDHAMAIALDSAGNVIITGDSYGSAYQDYATVKYSNTGAQLWVQRFNGPANNVDYAQSVAVDANDNVLVAGWGGVSTGYRGGTILKYSSAGTPIWTNYCESWMSSGNYKVAADKGGNVIVTGPDGTVKYSAAGAFLWSVPRITGGFYLTCAMALDAAGNVYVTGDLDTDYTTIAYSSGGLPLWTNRWDGPGNYRDAPRAIAVDANGCVYVTGQAYGLIGNYDFATLKFVTPPVIFSQPASRTNTVGTTASLTVEAASGAPLNYQWRLYGTNLNNSGSVSGVTTTNLVITGVQPAHAGSYTVVVTNVYGSETSSVAQLTVTIPPSPGRFTNCVYSPVNGFSFVFRDATPGKPYRIQTSTSAAPGSWVDWMSFNYTAPILLTDMEAVGITNKFYRVVTP